MRKSRRTYTDEAFIRAVQQSKSWAQVLARSGLKDAGGTRLGMKRLARDLGIDISHMTGQGWNVGLKFLPQLRPLAEILVEDSDYVSTPALKRRLLKEGLKKPQCEVCGIKKWRGKPAPIELDHINGRRTDNRLNNLRIICPNCHAQTEHYRGRNKGWDSAPKAASEDPSIKSHENSSSSPH